MRKLSRSFLAALLLCTPLLAIDLPELSSVLKAPDLQPLVQKLISSLESDLTSSVAFEQTRTRIEHSGYTLALYAEAVAQLDGDVAWKPNARAVRELAIQLAKATSRQKAQQLLDQIKQILDGSASGPNGTAKDWEEVAPLLHVMKEVNLVNRSLRRYVRRERYFNRYRDRLEAAAIAMTLLSYIAAHDNSPAKDPAKKLDNPVQLYDQYSTDFFNRAVEALEATRAGNYEKAKAAVQAMQDVCQKCHEDFRPDIEI